MTEGLERGRAAPIWQLSFGVFVPPAVWALQFNLGYFVVTAHCLGGVDLVNVVLAVVSIAALLGSVTAGVISYRAWRLSEVDGDTGRGTPVGRSGALAVVGLASSVIFSFAIILTGGSQFLVPVCEA